MRIDRSAGILCHITSLPGPYGIGTLGPEAVRFAQDAKKAGFSYWQILPIGPVDPALGFSPYASTSTFAGNYLFLSLEALRSRPYFPEKPDGFRFGNEDFVYFENVIRHKSLVLEACFARFDSLAEKQERAAFEAFCEAEASWLDDYALFTSVAEAYGTNAWLQWDPRISMREPGAAKEWTARLSGRISFHKFVQFLFFEQWGAFRDSCRSLGLKIIGDIPIYVTLESADAWANPDILLLDPDNHRPESVSGVPPDYFSETGQRWGNPLYRWFGPDGGLNPTTLDWWAKRVKHMTRFADVIRIDHFRGFEAFWSIPAEEKTAVNGEWVKGPGLGFFRELHDRLGDLPLIAEDLGVITPEVEELRDTLGLPGMRILQFAFDGNNKNTYLPHGINNPNCLLYTGTHDNNTTNGWFYGGELDENMRRYVMEYIGCESISDFHWRLIREAYKTVARLAVIPAQDILGFGPEFRMNTPGTVSGNWGWKLREGAITEEIIKRLARMARIYDRFPAED